MTSKKRFNLALVTGASSGIGEALSRKLAGEGISLIISGRNLPRLEALAAELSLKVYVEVVSADLTDRNARKKIVDVIQKQAPDLLINNAGYGSYGDALNYETQEMLDLLEVDANAVLEFSLEAARALTAQQKKGVIMNISSSAAFQIFPSFSVYSAAKAFVNRFSESFDQEMQPHGIRVLAACPGIVATGFRSRAAGVAEVIGGVNKIEETGGLVMSVDFAATEIWKQIESGKPIHVFDWKYRVGTILSKYFLPKWLVARVLRKNIEKLQKTS